MSEMLKITGLWENTGKDGQKYLAGNLGNVRVMVFPNKWKQAGSKEPDYNLFFAPKNRQEGSGTDNDVPF